ncbi:hypothetical protein D3C59_36665 [Streptomyces sp. SHP22-7]|nr:hypothetical protein D3C59_36665 [Streptomyces sp. SHP22-7]
MGGVGSHSKQILRKLGAQTSAHAVFLACAAGTSIRPAARRPCRVRGSPVLRRGAVRGVLEGERAYRRSGVRRVKPPKLPENPDILDTAIGG